MARGRGRVCFLRWLNQYPGEGDKHLSIASARRSFALSARELWRFGQSISATIHVAPTREECDEYPDYVIETGPRGGIRFYRA